MRARRTAGGRTYGRNDDMDLGLTNKRALVLASSSGLGLGIASVLCREGANVLLTARSGDKLAAAVETLNSAGRGRADYVVTDLSEPNAAIDLHSVVTDRLGGLDILVNNTGGPPPGDTEAPCVDTWRAQFDTMVVRLIQMTNLSLPAMRDARWGRILTVASSGVLQPIPELGISNTIRSALVGWNKSLANEVAADGITVNILAPGRIATPRLASLDANIAEKEGKSPEEVQRQSVATIPARRYGTVEEFAAVAAFLVSEPASYVTGGTIRCDGGAIRGV